MPTLPPRESIEIELPLSTIEAIKAYASAGDMSFDEATQRFINLGWTIEQIAKTPGVQILTILPEARK